MGNFVAELRRRAASATDSLAAARAAGDDYLVSVRLGELSELHRLAADHGVDLTGEPEELSTASPSGTRST